MPFYIVFYVSYLSTHLTQLFFYEVISSDFQLNGLGYDSRDSMDWVTRHNSTFLGKWKVIGPNKNLYLILNSKDKPVMKCRPCQFLLGKVDNILEKWYFFVALVGYLWFTDWTLDSFFYQRAAIVVANYTRIYNAKYAIPYIVLQNLFSCHRNLFESRWEHHWHGGFLK